MDEKLLWFVWMTYKRKEFYIFFFLKQDFCLQLSTISSYFVIKNLLWVKEKRNETITHRQITAIKWMYYKCFISYVYNTADSVAGVKGSTSTRIILNSTMIVTMFDFLEKKSIFAISWKFKFFYFLFREIIFFC